MDSGESRYATGVFVTAARHILFVGDEQRDAAQFGDHTHGGIRVLAHG